MQAAVYSTATDVKIHKAIRQEWASFEAWLFEQQKRLERRELQILSAAQRKWGKMRQADKQEILALRQELVALARRQWLARVRQGLLSLQHWVITPEEKQRLQQTLGWTQKEMIDAWVQQQAELGPMYQRVDPTSLGTKDPSHPDLLDSPSRFKHPPERTGPIPAYTNWAAELAKMSAAASSSHKTQSHKPQPAHKPQPTRSIKSVDLPSMPLYFVGALLQGTDLDAVAAADLEAFALHASEEKIREYYDAACEASVHFQRVLAAINPAQRDAAQEDFERRMRELASAKEREWKAVTVKELQRYQAAEMEHRAAQQRAMRSPPQRAMRSPPQRAMRSSPRRPRRRELSEWDYLDEYTHSPRRDRDPDYSSTYQSSHRDGSRRDDYYPDSYLSPQVDYLHPYHSPPGPAPDRVEAYHSPRLQRRTNPSRRPPVVEEEEEDYAVVSPSVDDNFNPRLRRRNALHRVEEEEEYESEIPEHDFYDHDHNHDPYALSPRAPYEMRALYQEQPLETGLLSTLTKWTSKLGTFLSGGKGSRPDSISSFGWMETNAVDHYGPLPNKHKRNASKSAHTQNHRHRQPKHLDTWAPQPDEEEEDFYESEEELESEEEFPMRRGKSWREKLSWSLPKLRKGKRNRSPTGSDYGWADRDSD